PSWPGGAMSRSAKYVIAAEGRGLHRLGCCAKFSLMKHFACSRRFSDFLCKAVRLRLETIRPLRSINPGVQLWSFHCMSHPDRTGGEDENWNRPVGDTSWSRLPAL